MNSMNGKEFMNYSLSFAFVQFAVLFFLFRNSGIAKVLTVFLALILLIEIPGSAILHFVTKRLDSMTILFGLAIGLMNVTLAAYLFGIFSISLVYSLVISVGLPYFYLARQPSIIGTLKNISKDFKIE